MNSALQIAVAYLQSQDIKCKVLDRGDAFRVGFSGFKNLQNMEIIVIFDDNNRTMGLRSYSYMKVPEGKLPQIYAVCSKMNQEFRWVKFYVDDKDSTVTLADDAVIDASNCGPEIYELIMRMAGIADDAYPEFMKAVWA